MATKTYTVSNQSGKGKSWSYTIAKSSIDTWIDSNIPANATINSVSLTFFLKKSVTLTTGGTWKVTVAGSTAFEGGTTSIGGDEEGNIKSHFGSRYINGDIVINCSCNQSCTWTLNDIKITFDYTEHTHTEVTIPAVAPTCTATGLTEGKKCSVCGTIITAQQTVAALGHSWNATTYTWSADGKSCTAQRVCSRDSSHKETATATITSAVKTAATCTDKGTTTYTAKFSVSWATTQTKDIQDISAKGHTWIDATCTAPKTCSVCGATEGSALGHNYVGAITKQPTCTEKGVKTYTCQNDSSHKYTEEIPAKGHTAGTAVIENRIEATCTADGSYDEVVYCSVCGAEISRNKKTIPAKGHSYTTQTVEPTETSYGYTRHTCSVCGDSYDTDYTCRLKIEVENGTVEGVVDGGIYAKDSKVRFTAIANEGYKFTSAFAYYSDGSSTRYFEFNTGFLTFDSNITFVVNFKPMLPEITSVQMLYQNKQISATNKVPAEEYFRIVVGANFFS